MKVGAACSCTRGGFLLVNKSIIINKLLIIILKNVFTNCRAPLRAREETDLAAFSQECHS